MTISKRNLKIIIRIIIWFFYLLSGFYLYTQEFILPLFLGKFAKFFYPLSIFWLQIRIKNKEPWLPLTDSMSTSQLWFRLIPIVASLLAFIIVSMNLVIKVVFALK
tara:strand:+ start:106 stop:423 length:318 start_codon:yes stop_codon:yes gene_type:complete